MSNEYLAVFSMHDHKKPVFRRSLLSFDKIVFPVPSDLASIPTNDLNEKELEQYLADANYLEAEGAAVQFDWNANDFQSWCQLTAGNRWEEFHNDWFNCATRLYLQQKYDADKSVGNGKIIPVPVFLNRKIYEATNNAPIPREEHRLMLEVILKQIPVPSDDVALEKIIELRNRPSFQNSLNKLRDWQTELLPQLLQGSTDEKIRKACKDFESHVEEYSKAIESAKFKKKITVFTWAFSTLGLIYPTIAPILPIILRVWNPEAFSIKEMIKPSWKTLSEKPFALAGVVYESSKLKQ